MRERKTALGRILRYTAVVLVTIIIAALSMLAVTKLIYDAIFPRFDRNPFETALNISYSSISSSYPREEVEFLSGDNLLKGYIYGEGNSLGMVVIVPGFSDGAEDYTSIAMDFADKGYRVFAFDSTGSFESQGESSVGFSQIVIDLDNALSFIEAQPEYKGLPLFLFGHSRGGYGAAMMCNSGHNISAIATIGGVNSPMEITMEWSLNYVGYFAYTGYPALFAYQSMIFGSEIMITDSAEALASCDTPALIIHCENDETVSVDGSSIYAHKDEVENKNAEFMLYDNKDNAGHTTLLFTKEANSYRDNVRNEYESLKAKHDGNIPTDEANAFFESIDALKANEVNTELLDMISNFYLSKI